MLLVQLGINSTRDVWKFATLDSPRRLVEFGQNFQASLVLLIPNCTRHRMITYTKQSLSECSQYSAYQQYLSARSVMTNATS
jgi:hypothetical protein